MSRRLSVPLVLAFVAALLITGGASPAPTATYHRPIVSVGANKSNNWSGYNQGTIEQRGKTFTSVSGTWRVPTATAHKAGENEYSSSWVGIGGGCVNANCTITDTTLIQAGTEQDVDSSGRASYYAWWELIPAPSVRISPSRYPVAAGDVIRTTIGSPAPGIWTFNMRNQTRGWTWTMRTPYSSSMDTAEWIEETPVVIDNSGHVSVGPLPNLSGAAFDLATTNAAPAGLKASEEIQLVDFNGTPLATPSAPDPDADGFNDCTYASSCAAPAGS